ncbi:MAG: DUF4372 domain-containing protein [Lentisphaeria bacterium]|nr:DUF4372 domain-containing protein [Lentisphaeria bacterium]
MFRPFIFKQRTVCRQKKNLGLRSKCFTYYPESSPARFPPKIVPVCNSIFQQLFNFIPRYRFEKSVKNLSGNWYCKNFSRMAAVSGRDHLVKTSCARSPAALQPIIIVSATAGGKPWRNRPLPIP